MKHRVILAALAPVAGRTSALRDMSPTSYQTTPPQRVSGGNGHGEKYNRSVVGIYETFSKRLKRRERAGQPDIYQYDDLPGVLRVQVFHILRGMLGHYPNLWDKIHGQLTREMGVLHLGDNARNPSDTNCVHLLQHGPTLEVLDLIELSFLVVSDLRNLTSHSQYWSPEQSPEEAVDELNYRFREHGVGYQFEGGEIVRVDSQYVHAEAVKPAISLLNTSGFSGASDEFLKAHEHYRKGRFVEATNEALKAFESTMKAICDKNGWTYRESDAAKALIKTVLDRGLVPKYMETHLSGLRSTLEAGLPTVRNKNSGHGQGLLSKKVPDYFAGYALHLAASNIVFLVEAHEALNRK